MDNEKEGKHYALCYDIKNVQETEELEIFHNDVEKSTNIFETSEGLS